MTPADTRDFIAPTLKLIGNSMLLGCLEILAESYTLAEKAGIADKDVQHIVEGPVLSCIHLVPSPY